MMFATVYLIMNTCCLCDVMTCLFDMNKYGDVDFMSIVMSDDDVLIVWSLFIESHTFHKRRGLLCQAMMAFMPSKVGLYAKCP